MDSNIMLGLFIISPLLLMAAVLLTGRGSWLIAGFHKAEDSIKAKYNEPRLCRAFGGYLLVMFLATTSVLLLRNSEIASVIYTLFIIVWSAVLVLFANNYCKV